MAGDPGIRCQGEQPEIALAGRPSSLAAVYGRWNALPGKKGQGDIADLHGVSFGFQLTRTALPMTWRSISACTASAARSSGKLCQIRGLSLPCAASATSVLMLAAA